MNKFSFIDLQDLIALCEREVKTLEALHANAALEGDEMADFYAYKAEDFQRMAEWLRVEAAPLDPFVTALLTSQGN